MYQYKLLLRFAFPSTSAPTSFIQKKDDLEVAAKKFNEKFLGRKKIKIEELNGVAYISLLTHDTVTNPTREISAFSKILKNDLGWEAFTQNANRMFDVTIVENPNDAGIGEERSVSLNFSEQNGALKTILAQTDIIAIEGMIKELTMLLRVAESKKIILEAERAAGKEN